MKSSFIILLFLLPVLPVWGQFKVGYGLGWFPSGMNSLNVAQRYFNESKVAENIYGPLKDEGNYLPVYHGVAFEWSTTKRKKTNLQMNWINLHNKGESSRTNISDITYYHRTKSRINTFLIGMKTKPSSSRLSWVSSFTLQGFMSSHTYLYSIGADKSYSDGWDNKERKYNFGLDAGINFKLSNRAQLFVHYSRGLLLFSKYNTTYFGTQLFFQLTKSKI